MPGHVEQPIGVPPLVIVPGDELKEPAIQLQTAIRVENAGATVVREVAADHMRLCNAHYCVILLSELLDSLSYGF